MNVICKNYNKQAGYYEGIAIVAEEGESKGSEENPFTVRDISKAKKELEDKELVRDSVATIYIGKSEDDVFEILKESGRIFYIE